MKREEIHIIARHSDWQAGEIDKALKSEVYPKPREWYSFLKWSSLALGATLFLSGVIFFFAYNWQYLHKFGKMGIVAGLLILLILLAVFAPWQTRIKKALLISASVFVGVLFAVFGQIYQTGANAYDFFLAWTIFSVAWVVTARSAVLWLLFGILLNTTYFLYIVQVASMPLREFGLHIGCLLNFGMFLLIHFCPSLFTDHKKARSWLSSLFAMASALLACACFIMGLWDTDKGLLLLISVILAGVTGLSFYIAGISARKLSLVVIVNLMALVCIVSVVLRLSQHQFETGLLLNMLFVPLGLYLMVQHAVRVNKKWKDDGEQVA